MKLKYVIIKIYQTKYLIMKKIRYIEIELIKYRICKYARFKYVITLSLQNSKEIIH